MSHSFSIRWLVTLAIFMGVQPALSRAAETNSDQMTLNFKPNQSVQLCPSLASLKTDCRPIVIGADGLKFHILKSFRNATGSRFYHYVRFENSDTGYLDDEQLKTLSTPVKFELLSTGVGVVSKCSEAVPEPQIGMSRAQVNASCWGRPAKVLETSTMAALYEDYFYYNGDALRLSNGYVLLKVQQR